MSQAIIWFTGQLHRIVNAGTSHSLIGMALFNTLQEENRNSSSCTDYFKHGCHPGNSYIHVHISTFQHRATWRSPDLVKDALTFPSQKFYGHTSTSLSAHPACCQATRSQHSPLEIETGLSASITFTYFIFMMGILIKAILLINIIGAGEATTPVWKLPLILVSSHPNIFAFSKHQDFQRPNKRSLFLWFFFQSSCPFTFSPQRVCETDHTIPRLLWAGTCTQLSS